MNNSMILSLIAVAWLTGLAGCEPTDNVIGSKPNTSGMGGTGDGSDGGMPQGGTSQDGTAGKSSSSLGGTAGTTNNNGGTAGSVLAATGGAAGNKASCGDYLDATDGRVIEVIVKNDRSAPVYVGNRLSQCWQDGTLSVYDASGNQLNLDEYPSMSCTCEDYMQKGSYGCMVGACLRSPLVRLAPGETMARKWDGYYLGANRAFRTECAVQGEPRDTCYSTLAAPSGKYKVAVLGSTSYGCAWESEQFDCNCVETNSCGFGMVPLEGRGEMLQPSIDFDLMSTQSVTVRFTESMGGSGGAPPTAGGNAGAAGSAGSGTSGAPPTPGGGNAGAGSGGAPSVNIHKCASPAQYPCYNCDPLPAGSTEGCPPASSCSGGDTASTVRYPPGCGVVFSEMNRYYPENHMTAICWGPSPFFWACQL